MRKLVVGSVALAIVGVASIASAAAGSSSPRHEAEVDRSATTVAPTTTASSVAVTSPSNSTSTSTSMPVPKPVDPMADGAMLSWGGRYIKLRDAGGKELRTLVTAYEDRVITDAQLMGDHHTIWYATQPNWSMEGIGGCNEIVKLDLATNQRTVIAHAYGFAVAGNRDRVVLTGLQSDAECFGFPHEGPRNVVRDISTGTQSEIRDDQLYGFAISPGGHVLVSTQCTTGDAGCYTSLRTATIPDDLGAPIALTPANNQRLSLVEYVAHDDGLYAIVTPHPVGHCGEGDDGSDRHLTVRRYSWTDMDSPPTIVATIPSSLSVWNLVVSPAGTYVVSSPSDAGATLIKVDGETTTSLVTIANPSAGDFWTTFESFPEFAG